MSKAAPAPRHLWVIGIVTLLWNLMGAYDYLMTETQNATYMAQFDQAQLDYFYGFPVWFIALWAIAVWGGLAGSVLLLLRKGLAAPAFLASFVAMIFPTIYSFGFSNGMEVMGATGFVFTSLIFLVSLGLVLYSRAMRTRGVLV